MPAKFNRSVVLIKKRSILAWNNIFNPVPVNHLDNKQTLVNMRTSSLQFEMLVSFMERHGDLSRPCDSAHGRITNIQRWEELTNLLNGDISGGSKPVDKWRKVWSDLKNNTKRKAAKIHSTATGTGGGPACRLKLTELEERVLAILNPQAATGMPGVFEVGLEQDPPPDLPEIIEFPESSEQAAQAPESWNLPGNSARSPILQPNRLSRNQSSPPTRRRHTPASPRHRTPATPRRRSQVNVSPRAPRRRRDTATATALSELARQAFLNSDREWRELSTVQETQRQELERERLRLRQIELQQQARWQGLFAQFLSVLQNGCFTFRND